MQIFKKIREFFKHNIQVFYFEGVKKADIKIKKNKKLYTNFSKISPKIAEKLLRFEEYQKEDPYKLFLLFEKFV